MARKRRIQPGEKIGLKLTQAERHLLLEALLLPPKGFEQAVRSTPPSEPLMLGLDELDDLAGHVAAAANHAATTRPSFLSRPRLPAGAGGSR